MIHTIITLALAALAYPFGLQQEIAFLAAAFYTGREHAQAEYRTVYTNYSNKRSNTPAAITGVYTFSSVTDYGLLSTHWAESTSTYHT